MSEYSGTMNERTVFTYKYLRAISYHAFEEACKNEIGRFNNIITSMLFSAFCLEAFLNHIGREKVSGWDIDQGGQELNPTDKLNKIASVIDYICDKSRRPFQSFGSIFKFRNHLAHGKTVTLRNSQGYLSDWEKQINLRTAEMFVMDTKEMIQLLGKAADYNLVELLEMERPNAILKDLGDSSMVSS